MLCKGGTMDEEPNSQLKSGCCNVEGTVSQAPEEFYLAAASAVAPATADLRAELKSRLKSIPGGFFEMGARKSRFPADFDSPITLSDRTLRRDQHGFCQFCRCDRLSDDRRVRGLELRFSPLSRARGGALAQPARHRLVARSHWGNVANFCTSG